MKNIFFGVVFLVVEITAYSQQVSRVNCDYIKEKTTDSSSSLFYPELEKRRTAIMAGKELSHASADKYIDERNQKRARIFDIPEHKRFNGMHAGEVSLAGMRQVDGQALAFLRKDELILVLPVDVAMARRLQKVKVGDPISVTACGMIHIKGRSWK